MITLKEDLMRRNVILSYIQGGLMWGRFFIPVLALFYIASQVTLAQFSIIMAVFAFSTFILEIPTGVLADIIGKKKTLIISKFMYLLEIILIAFFNGFWIFLVAKIISGIGVSLASGTDSAFLYDSLKKMKKEKEYKRIMGIKLFVSNISMAFVFLIGAYLFTLNPKLPAKLSLIPIALGFILAFFFSEPYHNTKKLTMANSWAHFKEGLGFFWKNNYLKYLAMLTFIVLSVVSIMLSFSSAYFKEILIPVSLIGAVSFIGSMVAAYSSKKAHKLEEILGEKYSLQLVKVALVVSVLFMSFMIPYFGILFIFLIQFVWAFFSVLIQDYANKNVDSAHRATMLSINNMFSNIGNTIILPFLGWGIKISSMGKTFFGFALFILIYLGFVYIYRLRRFDRLMERN